MHFRLQCGVHLLTLPRVCTRTGFTTRRVTRTYFSAMASRVAKRQKLNTENVRAAMSSAVCVSFDALTQEDYPPDLIAENALRMLSYGHLEGIGEVLSLAIRFAGCLADFVLESDEDGRVSDTQIECVVDEIETACIRNECPATFPAQKRALLKRLVQLLSVVTAALLDSESFDVVRLLSRFVATLSKTRIQSLRYTATIFAGTLLRAVASNGFSSNGSVNTGRGSSKSSTSSNSMGVNEDGNSGGDAETLEILAAALSERCSDIAVAVRRRAVADLGTFRSQEAARALNDANGTVRLSALHTLGDSMVSSEANAEANCGWAEDTYARVVQLAVQDVDLPVRRASLRLLAARPNANVEAAAFRAELAAMLQDEDGLSRKLAAEAMLACEPKLDAMLLVALAHTNHLNRPAALALASALVKMPAARSGSSSSGSSSSNSTSSNSNSGVSVELMRLLTTDFDKESRKPRLSAVKRQEFKTLASAVHSDATVLGLLELLDAVLSVSQVENAFVLNHAATLIQRLQYSEKLLARAIVALTRLPFQSLMHKTETEAQVAQFFETCRDIFMQRNDSRTLIEAVGSVFVVIPESVRHHLLEDIHQDLRIQLARLLGPRGEFPASKADQVHATMLQVIVIGRHVDISDVAKLPLWSSLASGDAHVQQLVRAIGMKGDARIVNLVVQKLATRKPAPAVDDILRVLVSAKMRNIDADTNLPVDLDETQPTSESVWRSAVAAGVI